MMCGKKLPDKIANRFFRERTDVEDVYEQLRGHRLRWLKHLEVNKKNAKVINGEN